MGQDPIEIEFRGPVPSTKNRYTPRKGGKGFFKSGDLDAALNRLAIQIPGQYRDLKLESPEIHVYFKCQSFASDRTNKWQAVEDLLVKYGVLANDNTRRSNGTITIHPTERDEYDTTRIILIPREEVSQSSRYIDPRRKRRAITGDPPSAPVIQNEPPSEFPDWVQEEW
jgi:Holliday junction resolvase RusA-like endonuclease